MFEKGITSSLRFYAAVLFGLCCALPCGPGAAAGKPVPMDAAASAVDGAPADSGAPEAGSGAWSSGESGAWSLKDQEARDKAAKSGGKSAEETPGAAPAADDQAFHTGYWSAQDKSGDKPGDKSPAAAAGAEDQDIYQQHSFVVTLVQKCYDQLDPASAAEIQKNYVKPYEECQRRLAEKIQMKKHAKDAQLQEQQTAESPRNYVRVQNP